MTISIEGAVFLSFSPHDKFTLSQTINSMGPGVVYCSNTARMAGAAIAAGTPQALAELRKQLAPASFERQKSKTPSLSDEANAWLSHGDRSLASESIFQFLTGVPLINDWSKKGYPYHPKSVAEFLLCQQLLDAVPELQQPFHTTMATASAHWAKLVESWASLNQKARVQGTMAAHVAILELLEPVML